MARTKCKPIDVSKYKSNVEDDSMGIEPSFITFEEDGIIGEIAVHREYDCIDIRSTWISQALTKEAGSHSNQNMDGTFRNRHIMRANICEDVLRERLHRQQNKRTRIYIEASGITHPRPLRAARMDVNYPKQVASPPINNTLNRLAVRSRGRTANGRMSLLEHWQQSRGSTRTQIKSKCVSSEMTQARTRPGRVLKGGVTQKRTASKATPTAKTTQERSKGRIVPVREIGAIMGGNKVGEPSSSGESDYYLLHSGRKRAPAPPARPASAATTVSPRACINCYERHSGCDRSLTGCATCKEINLTCVYPDVYVKKSPKKRNR
ncbi:hypothetical protein DSL72_003782 [Monilinia vaccinii-corymbosi]|uniref:Zn(2)-C6 fungal-type domain-containing protein n=1 Tax=Monilinia vaccinii-corymbosi TaxID=61207 RepID=A0A8A3NYU5_9HELO|nr:hypothetical protein DSL72_003782 [Monilinia vaccinii-corymbosi]